MQCVARIRIQYVVRVKAQSKARSGTRPEYPQPLSWLFQLPWTRKGRARKRCRVSCAVFAETQPGVGVTGCLVPNVGLMQLQAQLTHHHMLLRERLFDNGKGAIPGHSPCSPPHTSFYGRESEKQLDTEVALAFRA